MKKEIIISLLTLSFHSIFGMEYSSTLEPNQITLSYSSFGYLGVFNFYSNNFRLFTVNPGYTLTEILASPFSIRKGHPLSITYSPDGQCVAYANNGRVSIYRVNEEGILTSIGTYSTDDQNPVNDSNLTALPQVNNDYDIMEYPNPLALNQTSVSTSQDGPFVAIADQSLNSMIILRVDAHRNFTVVHSDYMSLANSPNGRHLKVTNQNSQRTIILRINYDCSLTVIDISDAHSHTDCPNQIKDSTITVLSQSKDGDDVIEKENCIICHKGLSKKEINLSCNHNLMHYACLAQWMEMNFVPTCPLCRKEIVCFDDFGLQINNLIK